MTRGCGAADFSWPEWLWVACLPSCLQSTAILALQQVVTTSRHAYFMQPKRRNVSYISWLGLEHLDPYVATVAYNYFLFP